MSETFVTLARLISERLVAAITQILSRTLAWLERLAARPLGALVLFLTGLGVYGIQAIAWPLKPGRDLDEYLYAYIQLFDRDVLLPWSMLFRTPLTPVVSGVLLDPFGGALAEPVCAILYAGSIVAWAVAGSAFGPRVALVTGLALLAYPGYALMFHELASETVFAATFALWALLVTRAATTPSLGRFVLVGLGIALLALARPGNAVLLVFALLPLTLAVAWRQRLGWAAAVALAAVLPLAAWTVHNGLRFDKYTLARGGNAIIPFYRAFITDRIVSPENGPDSRRLGRAVEQHLLTREPYRSYGVTLDDVFESGSFRIHEDLYLLSDQVFGWDSDYAILRNAGIEAVRKHPRALCLRRARNDLATTERVDLPGRTTRGQGATQARPPRRRRSSSAAGRCPHRPRGSRSRADRWSGSHDPTTPSVRCGRHPLTTGSPSPVPLTRRGSTAF